MKIRTHDGVFHADEAMAVAIIQLLKNKLALPKPEIIRTRREVEADLYIDVGMKYDGERYFDHHQPGGAGTRLDSNVAFASAGLIWKTFGLALCRLSAPSFDNDRVAELMHSVIDSRLIRPIDAVDTGWNRQNQGLVSAINFSFSDLVRSLNDLENGNNEAWDEALHICRVALMAALQGAFNWVRDNSTVDKAIQAAVDSNQEVAILPAFLAGWHQNVFMTVGNDKLKYALYPNTKGEVKQWMAEAIPNGQHDGSLRLPFPQVWAGIKQDELRQLTGVPDAIFCHMNGFLCGAESQEGALQLARLSLKQQC